MKAQATEIYSITEGGKISITYKVLYYNEISHGKGNSNTCGKAYFEQTT